MKRETTVIYHSDHSSVEGKENVSPDYCAPMESGNVLYIMFWCVGLRNYIILYSGGVVARFQQQQGLLQTLLTQQQEMRDEMVSGHADIDTRLLTVEEQLKNADQSGSSNSGLSSERKKTRVMRDLSVGYNFVVNVHVHVNVHTFFLLQTKV